MKFALTSGAVAAVAAAVVIGQQPDALTEYEASVRVYEPQPVSPSDERVARLSLPRGFHVQRFAEGLENPRILAVADDGTVYVTQRRPGNLVMLRDVDGDGLVDAQKVVLEIPGLHGIEISGRRIYLVDVDRIHAGEIMSDGRIGKLAVVSDGLPDGGQHPNRTLGLGPDGRLYVSVGSTCNACDETDPESATILRLGPAGGKREIFAAGLRNTIGFGWHPGTGKLYGLDNGIDWLGDEKQSEELNLIEQGKTYGWPYVYDDGQFNPQDEPPRTTQRTWAQRSVAPVSGYAAHAAPMQLAFYEAGQFPEEYRGDAFAAMRGSWNRKPPSGYEVVRLRFAPDGAFEGFESFLTGFLQDQPDRKPPLPDAQPKPADGFIGRPVGIAVAKDGALIVGDDSNNVLYRVVYGAPRARPLPQKLASEILTPKRDEPIEVRSSAFADGEPIPMKYSDYGEGVSPPLAWDGVPEGTRSIVLLMEDPDATSPLPFVHWLVANIDPGVRELPENIARTERPNLGNAVQGGNSRSRIGYLGPRPPPGEPPHHYHVQLFALDTALELPSGFNRNALLRAMDGHVLARGELLGTFARAP